MSLSEFLFSYGHFLFQNFLVALAALALLRLVHGSSDRITKIILFFLYYFALIVVIMTGLGVLRILNATSLLITLIILNIALAPFVWKKKYPAVPREKFNLKIFILYVPLIIILLIKLVNASLSAVTETDSLVYHLPFAVQWYQTQSIWEPYYTAYAGPLGYYPGNYELLSLFVFFPFKQDILVNLVNFALYIPFALTLINLGQILGLKKIHAAVAGTLFLFTPIIIRQGGIPQNDLFFIFTLSVAVFFALRAHLRKEWNFENILPIGLSLGLFIGTKSSGIVYGGLAFLCLMFCCAVQKKPRLILSMILLAFIAGGFWYLRNWIATGNPLFPMSIALGGMTIFPGFDSFYERLKDSSLASHLDFATFRQVAKALFLSTGMLIFIVVAGFLKGLSSRQIPKILLLVLPVTLGLYLITPFSYANIYPNIRYLLPFFLIGYVLFLMVWRGKFASLVYVAGLGNFILIIMQKRFLPYINDYVSFDLKQIFAAPSLFALAAILFACGVFLYFSYSKNRKAAALPLLGGILIFGFFLQKSLPLREENFWKSFTPAGRPIYNEKILEAFEYTDKNLPTDAHIAFTRGPAHYPLFGKHWERDVDYINVNECFECLYHDYRTSQKSILRDPNYNHWMVNLKRAKKDYLFIGQKVFESIPPYEFEWTEAHPERFKPLFENDHSFLYKINW